MFLQKVQSEGLPADGVRCNHVMALRSFTSEEVDIPAVTSFVWSLWLETQRALEPDWFPNRTSPDPKVPLQIKREPLKTATVIKLKCWDFDDRKKTGCRIVISPDAR